MKLGNIAFSAVIAMALCGCVAQSPYMDLQNSLDEFVKDKDANIGIAVIIDGRDTVEVNGNKAYPMLSVYKFPIALTLADHYRHDNLGLDNPIAVYPDDLHRDTYSPMTDSLFASGTVIGDSIMTPARHLIVQMLQLSDNNASDIVLRELSGAEAVDNYLRGLGITDIHVRSSEAQMQMDHSLSYVNSSTPIAMAALMDRFDKEFDDSVSCEIKRIMETCATGTSRLAKPLNRVGAVIGHKTGTGFTLPDGRLMAVNDAGYVHLHDGRRYSIAVFIENSGYDMEQTEAIIAEISELVATSVSECAKAE